MPRGASRAGRKDGLSLSAAWNRSTLSLSAASNGSTLVASATIANPHTTRARHELSTAFVVGGTIAGAVLAGVAYNGLFVDVHCTNRDAEAARLVLDDDVIAVGKGTTVRYVRTGSHVFGVECPSGKRRLFRASLTADDRVYVDAQTLCEGGEPKIERAYGGGGMGSPFRGI